ncbi:hypothetical protein Vadar_010901 [Vaccinium darrowii]|uniref:Uncharacterized protein n=1 Tax=Vaccinium darrowii TaxID=229202 RepID=A0ACB7ZJN6_9ERIC|nr:hypothetical protein Vadar_010901 [Vaccinium darrowii]
MGSMGKRSLQDTMHLLAVSGSIGFNSGCRSEHMHLAYMGRGMRVMLATHGGEKSFVKYGEREGGLEGGWM